MSILRKLFGPSQQEVWRQLCNEIGADELYLEVLGIIKDVARLKSLFELFAVTLHCLCHLGSAYENDPHLSL